MSKYHDDNTYASDPGGVELSKERLKYFRSHLGFFERSFSPLPVAHFMEHLEMGDSRAAMVMQTTPSLIVVAYTDEFDWGVLLEFPVALVGTMQPGTRLLTVNTYRPGFMLASDLAHGPKTYKRYSNFFPLIAEFLTDAPAGVEYRKMEIDEEEWQRTQQVGTLLVQHGAVPRDGNPYRSERAKKRNWSRDIAQM